MIVCFALIGLLQTNQAQPPKLEEPLVLRNFPQLEFCVGEPLRIEAPHGLEFVYENRRFVAEQMTLNQQKGLVSGSAAVRLLAPEGRMEGNGFEYYYRERRGWFNEAYVETDYGRFWADRIEGDFRRFTAAGVRITPCGPHEEAPAVLIRADRVRGTSDGLLQASKVRLQWKGRTLFSLPSLSLRWRQGTSEFGLPTPTYSSLTGWGLRWLGSFPVQEQGELTLGVAGYLRVRPESQLAFAWNLAKPQLPPIDRESGSRFQSGYLDSLIEGDPHGDLNRLRDPQGWFAVQRLSNVRASGRKESHLFINKPWEIVGGTHFRLGNGAGSLKVRLGTLEEWRPDLHVPLHQRVALEGEWVHPLVKGTKTNQREVGRWGGQKEKTPNPENRLTPLIPQHLSTPTPRLLFHLQAATFGYEERESFSWVRPQIEYLLPLSESSRIALGYLQSFRFGQTPLLFDDLDTTHELRFRGETQTGNFRLAVLLKYDLDERDLFDVQVLIGLRQHCLEPYFFWRKRPGSFQIGINLIATH